METLVSDCFPPIFSYLPLADLLHLRTVSRRLKQEVEDYLPTVCSLQLYLTTPRTPEEIVQYEQLCLAVKGAYPDIDAPDSLSEEVGFQRVSFGTSGPLLEDRTLLLNQNHFRCSNFLILDHSLALSKFLRFIKKHCPNIDKLALMIDDCDHYLPEVSKVLETFPAIKVLLLERTLQDAFRGKLDTLFDLPMPSRFHLILAKNDFRLEPEVYDSILELNRLEELYFFPKRQTQSRLDLRATRSRSLSFVRTLLSRLKVLHINTKDMFQLPVTGVPEGPLEELACQSTNFIRPRKEGPVIFPNLRKLTILNGDWYSPEKFNFHDSLPKSSLKTIDISNAAYFICPVSTENLNSFTGLESFHCEYVGIMDHLDIVPGEPLYLDLSYIEKISSPEW